MASIDIKDIMPYTLIKNDFTLYFVIFADEIVYLIIIYYLDNRGVL